MESFPPGVQGSNNVDHEEAWKGFCEIESEPALFNTMLHDFGVRGIQVREVVSLENHMLESLPRPVYGLIFLYRWTEMSTDSQEQACPPDIWFANQTVDNACASVALLNIVNNIPDIRLGDHLTAFRGFSMDLSPSLKGEAVANFEYVRAVHNSFARKIDMLNGDLALKNRARSKRKDVGFQSEDDEASSAFHFVAFMPIGEQLWKLDGLERQPLSLGCIKEDWLANAKADIEVRMSRYEEDHIEFAILCLVQDPICKSLANFIGVTETLDRITVRLEELDPSRRNGDTGRQHDQTFFCRMRAKYDDLCCSPDTHPIADSKLESMLESNDIAALEAFWRKLSEQRKTLELDLIEEEQNAEIELAKATTRKQDFGAKMQKFARIVEVRKRKIPCTSL